MLKPVLALFAALAFAAPASAAPAQDLPECTQAGIVPPAPANSHAMTAEDYPILSVALGEEGGVTLSLLVGADGKVADAQVETSSGFARLDEAAIAAAKTRWLYTPATRSGTALACRWHTKVVWKLHGFDFSNGMDKALVNVIQVPKEDFPPAALAAHEQGVTGLIVAVDENGKFAGVNVLHASGFPDLDEAAKALARDKWIAGAGRLRGKPAKTAFIIAVIWLPDAAP